MLIDFHTHIVPPRIKQNRENYTGDPLFRLLYDSPKAKLATAEDLIASMDKYEVDISVALNIGWSNITLCAETNDYIMESVARYPGRLIGFGTVPIKQDDIVLREIERCAEGNMKGIGEIRLDRSLVTSENSGLLQDYLNTVIANKLLLLLHSSEPLGHEYPGKGDTTPDIVYSIASRFPELRLIAAHWGGGLPFYAMMPEVKTALNNVFFDTAASPFLYNPLIYREVINIMGTERILMGSDYPLISPGRLVAEIRALNLPTEIEEMLLFRNAQQVLGISPA
jgi:predicted TIM-barrel fold metal-dependent hydrolase